MKLTIAALTLALTPYAANAQVRAGSQLHNVCTQDSDVCVAVVAGLWSGIVAGSEIALPRGDDARNAVRICVPSGVTYNQITDVMVTYLDEHPENRHYAASSNLIVSMRELFPCGEAL